MSFVLDASVALSWVFADEANAYGRAVKRRITTEPALVPPVWRLEIINTLMVGQRRNRITGDDARAAIDKLEGLKITMAEPRFTQRELLHFCETWRLTAYDATYLLLADQNALPLATNDRALRNAAATRGVPLFASAEAS